MHWLNINTDDLIPNFIFVLTNFIYCSLCNQFYKLYRQRKILVFTTLSVKSKIELKASCIHFQSQNKPVTHYHHTLLSTSYKLMQIFNTLHNITSETLMSFVLKNVQKKIQCRYDHTHALKNNAQSLVFRITILVHKSTALHIYKKEMYKLES